MDKGLENKTERIEISPYHVYVALRRVNSNIYIHLDET